MENTSSQKISEALNLLEEAAQQKKDELQSALADKYTTLRGVIVDTERNVMKSLSGARNHVVDVATHAKDVGVERARKISHDVDRNVHLNPWSYLAGTAVIGLLLGYILGRNRK